MAAKTNWHRYGTKLRHCHKVKGKHVTVDILLDNETVYLTDYTAIQRVSLNKFVFMSTASAMSLTPHILIHSAAIAEVLTLKIFLTRDTTTR